MCNCYFIHVVVPGVLVQSFIMYLAAAILIFSSLLMFVCVWVPRYCTILQCWMDKGVINCVFSVLCTSVQVPVFDQLYIVRWLCQCPIIIYITLACSVIPKYLCDGVLGSCCEWIMWREFMTLHLSGQKSISHVAPHCSMESRLVWRSLQSSGI